MGKVLLIGGSPMIGKSTIAGKIATTFGMQHLSTDDIGEMLQTVVDINPMKDKNYLEYYETTEGDELFEDMRRYHKEIGKAIAKMVDIHSSWGNSMIIEGYVIYPEMIVENSNVSAVWLIAKEELLENRLNESNAFASASEKAKRNYLERSILHNKYIEAKCKQYNSKFIVLYGTETVDEVMDRVVKLWS